MNNDDFSYEKYYKIFEFDFEKVFNLKDYKLTTEESYLIHYAEVFLVFNVNVNILQEH